MLDECQDRRSCQVLVNSRVFGTDQCPGSSKYLIVWYKCRPSKSLIASNPVTHISVPLCAATVFFPPFSLASTFRPKYTPRKGLLCLLLKQTEFQHLHNMVYLCNLRFRKLFFNGLKTEQFCGLYITQVSVRIRKMQDDES